LYFTEYRLRHVSGDWRWAAVRAVSLVDANGKTRGWVGMISDINEHKRAEEGLRGSLARLLALRDLDRAILEAHTPEDVASTALHHLARLIPNWRASATGFNHAAGYATVLAVDGATYYLRGMRQSLQEYGIEDIASVK